MTSISPNEIDWEVLNTYFQQTDHFMTCHHLDSFNDFVTNKIGYTIKTLNPFVIQKTDKNSNSKVPQYSIEVFVGGKDGDRIYLDRPSTAKGGVLFPSEARLDDMDYSSKLFADITIEYTTVSDNKTITKVFEKMPIGAIPIMVRSKLCALHQQSKDQLIQVGECPYDQGGYFILRGKEKVIIAQERIATNQLFLKKAPPSLMPVNTNDNMHMKNFKDTNDYSHVAFIRCVSKENSLFPKTVHFSVCAPSKARRNAILVSIPNIGGGKLIPLFALFRMFGVETDKAIVQMIVGKDMGTPLGDKMMDFLHGSVTDSIHIRTKEEAFAVYSPSTKYKSEENLQMILLDDVFPNVGEIVRHKALYLGYLIKRLILFVMNNEDDTERDNYAFKRIDLSGFLLFNLFRDFYNKFRNNVRGLIDQAYEYGNFKSTADFEQLHNFIKNKKHSIFDASILRDGMLKSLRGNWGLSNDPEKQGIVQDLNRLSYMGYVSHVRRVNTPIDRSIKLAAPHKLHSTQWGMVCPTESPDGGNVGLLKHFAVLCRISPEVEDTIVLEHLKELRIHDLDHLTGHTKVFLNGTWVGDHNDPKTFVDSFKSLRRQGVIPAFVSVSWNVLKDEIAFFSDGGRCIRPLYIMQDDLEKKLKTLMNKASGANWWGDFIHTEDPAKNSLTVKKYDGKTLPAIEYIDVYESYTSLIAMHRNDATDNKKVPYTHSEIHPSSTLSIYTNTIPYAHHNQAPRNVFSGAQGKQAIGVYATNFNKRIDTATYILNYPQKALVDTRYHKHVNADRLPNGANLIVAICTYTGYNQEDAVIINGDSIRRGMFNVTYYKSYKDKEVKSDSTGEHIIFKNPWDHIGQSMTPKLAKWDNLDENGLPKLNAYIGEDDVFLGKVKIQLKPQQENDEENLNMFKKEGIVESYEDRSVIGDRVNYGIIDKIHVIKDPIEDTHTVKLRFRKPRLPVLGDKMASRHGQKGTVGMILPSHEMPYTKEGIVPDMIVNPHAFPSRMTIGHLLETVFAKLGCLGDTCMDGTVFESHDLNKVGDALENLYGYERHGNEIMYNGRTGEQMETSIFFGPTYYYRLKHMVKDKVNYRGTGGVTTTTRQPNKGRSNGGGLRTGEMEKDGLISHGIMSFLHESLMKRSDDYGFYVDNTSATIAKYNMQLGKNQNDTIAESMLDENTLDFSHVKTPYSFKQMVEELECMGVSTRIYTDADKESEELQESHMDFVYKDDTNFKFGMGGLHDTDVE